MLIFVMVKQCVFSEEEKCFDFFTVNIYYTIINSD